MGRLQLLPCRSSYYFGMADTIERFNYGLRVTSFVKAGLLAATEIFAQSETPAKK